ncbi:nucleotidyltransferase family protein [Pyrolobus fumarii]|nr:nucleotidyltransferase family protein [Pyrolobus fumarii]
MKAAILAGGYGKRLRPLTSDRPKPLVEVAGKPIIVWQIEWLKNHGITEIIVLAGYLYSRLIEYLGNGSRFGVKIAYVIEEEPLGTGGALKNAEHLLRGEEYFLVLNGDIITNLDPLKLVKKLSEHEDAVGAIAAVPLRSPYGILRIDEGERIQEFVEKPILREYWINAGVYVMRPAIFDYLPERGDIEKTTFPVLAQQRKLIALRYHDVFWRSIDTYKDVEEVSKELQATQIL